MCVKGQLLALIETPEIDQQLQSAQADLKTAQANLDLANTTSARYQNLLKTNSVSKQETDVAVSGAEARKATVDAAEANVRRLEQLQGFEKVYAPFDGIITARNTDIGALIDAGENSTPQELFHMVSGSRLRVFVAVPEAYSPAIKDGDTATLTLDEYPGQSFLGRITRNSNAINLASRTLNVEVDIDNPKGLLLPGAYVFVHFKVPHARHRAERPLQHAALPRPGPAGRHRARRQGASPVRHHGPRSGRNRRDLQRLAAHRSGRAQSLRLHLRGPAGQRRLGAAAPAASKGTR